MSLPVKGQVLLASGGLCVSIRVLITADQMALWDRPCAGPLCALIYSVLLWASFLHFTDEAEAEKI